MKAESGQSLRSWCLAAGALALIGLAALLLASSGTRAANDPPPGGGAVSGDWTVTDSRAYNACTITLAGNLTVSGTGKLTLDAVSLVMDLSFEGQYAIEVQSGGELELADGSNLSSGTAGTGYAFAVRSGGTLTVTDSELRGCGYSWGAGGESAGVYLLSDSCRFERSLLASYFYGVVVQGASPAFTDCRFLGNSYGCAVTDSSASFSGCTFGYNANGANLDNCSGTFSNCTFAFNTGFGLLAYRSRANLTHCDLVSNGAGNCVLIGSDAALSNCTLRDSLYGLYIDEGRPSVEACSLTGNRYGAYLYKSSASFAGCTISQNSLYGISSYYGDPSLAACKIYDTGYSPSNGIYWGRGLEAFASNLSFSGGELFDNYYGIESRYSTLSVSEVLFTANSVGIYALESGTYLTGCNFTLNLQIGAHLTDFCSGAFEGCGFACETLGAAFEHLTLTELRNSTFRSCREGLRLYECDAGAAVSGCSFDHNSIGATVTGSTSRVLSCSFFSNVNYSLSCSGASAEIRNCSFRDCPTNALTLTACGGVIDGNLFDSVTAAGIYCLNSTSEISNNTFRFGNGTAIHSVGTGAAPNIHGNAFFGNGIGVALSDGSSGRIHHNNFTLNQQAGMSLSNARGEIYCNTVSGSVHGISCILLSDPSIHDNEVFGNDGGILCQDSSNATVSGNSVHDNNHFGILAMMSWPTLTGNDVWGSLDGIRVVGCLGPAHVALAGDRVFNNTDGLSGQGSVLEIEGCNFTLNRIAGAYLVNCSSSVRHSSFYLNRDGLHPEGGDILVEECDFLFNNDTGIITERTDAVVDGCFFYRNTDGALDLGNSTIQFIDGVFEDNAATGFYCQWSTSASWTVGKAASAADDWFALRGDLTVYGGGSLRLTNVTLSMMLRTPGEHAIEVHNGGRLVMLQGSKVEAAMPVNKYSFRLLAGGNLTIDDGTVQDCGYGWGVAGERAGLLLLSSSCALHDVYFYNCSHGLVANGITGDFNYLTFVSCGYGVVALNSQIRLENSSIYLSADADLQLQQGSVLTLVNTTFDRDSVRLLDPDCLLEVYWYLGVNVAWQNKVVVSHAQLTLDDAAGDHQFGGYTDDHGWLLWVRVLEYRQNLTSTDERNPYSMEVWMANISSKQDMMFKKSVIMYITLNDLVRPAIQIDFPQWGAKLNYSPVEIRGVAHDFETGLDRVEWSSDGRSWQPAFGAEQWDFLAKLTDGDQHILVRATDAVGNQAVVGLNFTVKTRITVLDVTAPAEGQITGATAILVNGTTETGANVQVNGRQARLVGGRFSEEVLLTEGNNTIFITATDDAGNTATITRTVVLDTTAPFIELRSPRNDSYINIRQTAVLGRTEPGAKVLVNGQVLVNSDGRFSQSVDLPDGTSMINITVLDLAGNVNSTQVVVHVDTVPPALDISSPRMGRHTGRGNITISGTTKPFSTVTSGEAVASAGEDGTFSLNVTILYGNNTLLIKSTDRAGNVNSVTWYVVRDRPSSGRNTPWIPAIILFVAVLAAENAAIFMYLRRRRTAPVAAETAEAELIPMATVQLVAEEPPAGALALSRAPAPAYRPPGPPGGGAAPPEALPVDDEDVESVEMK
jgi:parallel beta-helix repeat protein